MKLVVRNLNKSFDEHHVLNDIGFTVEKGKIYALLGRNGCGKTTLFNCIGQELEYESGEIVFEDGTPIKSSDVGFVYTDPMLPEFLTGYEFLCFFVDIHKDLGLKRADVHDCFDGIQFTIDDRHRLIKDYSHGMRNKLQMLAILLLKPKVILLDEPLTSFDVVASFEMKQKLLELKESSIMILSTHIMQIAQDICDEVIVMHNGTVTTIDYEMLHSQAFEQEITEMLRMEHEKE